MLSDSKIQRLQVNVYIYERPGQCATLYTNNIASEELSFCGNALSLSSNPTEAGMDTVEKQHGPGKLAFPLPYIVFLTHSSKCPCCAKLRDVSLINMHMVLMPS